MRHTFLLFTLWNFKSFFYSLFKAASKSIFDFIKESSVEKVEECVQKGVHINEHEKSKDKFTPLHCAAYYGSLEVFKAK